MKAGRGSPHGGVFLDISWIKEKIPNSAEHIKRKLPSMYHQFMQLANLDITKEPMEIGPTTHYAMGGIRVDAESQATNIPGLFAAGECAAGLEDEAVIARSADQVLEGAEAGRSSIARVRVGRTERPGGGAIRALQAVAARAAADQDVDVGEAVQGNAGAAQSLERGGARDAAACSRRT